MTCNEKCGITASKTNGCQCMTEYAIEMVEGRTETTKKGKGGERGNKKKNNGNKGRRNNRKN